ncbi:contact-dependent growth inhibition system immunity protein [Roseateles sp. BYS180W]|uniref:Contact-dependent growth inhibition system immunity protein n=1 Tax=Roseateles rivi TaxID=3299028 RepID=A0ABW7FRC6_9BURK
MTTNHYPELSDILGSYFHQDWAAEFQTDDAALQTIVAGESPARLKSAAAELDLLLRKGLAQDALRTVITIELGCFFEPHSRNLSWEEWLSHVKRKFEEGC